MNLIILSNDLQQICEKFDSSAEPSFASSSGSSFVSKIPYHFIISICNPYMLAYNVE